MKLGRKGHVAAATTQALDVFIPFRDRTVPSKKTTKCPSCGAEPGMSCRNTTTGEFLSQYGSHDTRRRAALRNAS